MGNGFDEIRRKVGLDEFITAETAYTSFFFIPIGTEQDERDDFSCLYRSNKFERARFVSVSLFRWHLRSKDWLEFKHAIKTATTDGLEGTDVRGIIA
jgi:hypothetical protein